MKFGLTEEQLEILHSLCITPLKTKKAQVWIFGSRARGEHSSASDIDVLFKSHESQPLSWGEIGQIQSDLEESRLPYKVDLVNIDELAKSYYDGVMAERVLV